ncbi:GNAT family N-acetyltransferase [Litoreibacter sp.]|nr:GNAT family N-acetyltransferase [Litoreibacter sp.]
MIIRPATLSDTVQMAEILNHVIAIGGTTAYEDPLEPAYFERLINAPDPKVFLHVAETSDGIQGLQWIEPLDPPNEHVGGIATFAKPLITQRGIGTTLFEMTKKTSRLVGYTELVAKIRADNTSGLRYYEKMGFRDYSIAKGEPLKDGTPVDRISKRLTL